MQVQAATTNQWPQRIASFSVAALFAFAIATKLYNPEQLLSPLQIGLGLSKTLSGIFFVLIVLALTSCVFFLIFRKGGLGLLLSAIFFLSGAAYSMTLEGKNYQGDCGCGITTAPNATNQLRIHTYQNSACAVLCIFLGFRPNTKGDSYEKCIS